jgi:hypothetical protein
MAIPSNFKRICLNSSYYPGMVEFWYLYTMEFYSAMKKNEILSFAGKWMELENIILSKVSQAQKTKTRMFSLICGL